MKKILACILSACILLNSSPTALAATDPPEELFSEAVCLMDAATGQVLFDKNMHEVLEPASITKIMTAALALEKGFDSSTTVEMTDDAIWSVGRDTTHVALTPGEIVPVKDILMGTMLQSANDCANGLALYVDGDLDVFAQHMTNKAHELGAVDTNFVNANGLPNPEHVTTAYDMALITKWALTVPGFREVFKTPSYKMGPTNLQPKSRDFYHGHKSLRENSDFYYEYATGGKTGWTEEARNTAVTLAEKDGVELIAVTLHAQEMEGRYSDIETVFEYGFKNYNHAEFSKERFQQAPVPVYDGEEKIGEVILVPKDVIITKPSTAAKADITIQLDLPIRYNLGETIEPKAQFILDDAVIAEVPFEFKQTINPKNSAVMAVDDEKGKKSGFYISPWICFTLAVLFLLIAALFGIRSINIIKYNQRMERRRRLERRNMGNVPASHPNARRAPPTRPNDRNIRH